ncbi:MAG: hypothetical protein ACON5N_14160 [Akkermansiaceae bacterium]
MKFSLSSGDFPFLKLSLLLAPATINAEDLYWINGPGNNTEIETSYGTAALPLTWFDTTKWFTTASAPQNPNAAVPLDGQSIAHQNSCCNPEPFIDLNNGGLGVNLPNSSIRFDAKTNLLDSSAGDLTDVTGGSYDLELVDDALIADTIAFNGAGGRGNDVYVPVTAKTLTSNRHGAVLNLPITVETILARSGHQDKWVINASPTAPLLLIELDENRGPDGGNIDGSFTVNADLETETLNHVWSRLVVGPGATLTVGTYNLTDYSTAPAPNNNPAPLVLDGNMSVGTFNFGDVEQAQGTWGAIGSGADNEASWITGEGLLTVGGGLPPKITSIEINNSREEITLIWNSRPGQIYSILSSTDLTSFETIVEQDILSDGDATTHSFPNPGSDEAQIFFKVVKGD